ncbi:MAG: hypothetical protein RRY55_05745 [Bacteroidales bacterium]
MALYLRTHQSRAYPEASSRAKSSSVALDGISLLPLFRRRQW